MEFELILGERTAFVLYDGYGSDLIIESIEDVDGDDMILSPEEHDYVYSQAMEHALCWLDAPFSER